MIGRKVVLLAAMAVTLVLGSGVALAATIVGINGNDTTNRTTNRDIMYGRRAGCRHFC